jgi:hypothetical protein
MEPMGHFTVTRRQVASRPRFREVQVPRSQTPAGGYETATSRFGSGAGTSRDGWRCSIVLELNSLLAECEFLGLQWMRVNFCEEKNPPKPHPVL